MEYEVEIKVKVLGTNADTMRSIRETWTFGDHPRWVLAGEAYVVEQTAIDFAKRIRHELEGAEAYNLNENSGNPRRA